MRSPRNPLYAGLIDSTDRDDGLNPDIPAFNALLLLPRAWVKGQNVCLARRVAGVRFGLFGCRLKCPRFCSV